MMSMELVGLAGVLLINAAYIPQIIKTYKTKNVEGLSITFFSMILFGVCLLQVYSVSIWDTVYIASNSIAILTLILLLILIKKYQKRSDL